MSNVATIYDVAREAGVSISTVSNALNRPHKVGESTRQRVLQVADELGYMPKPAAAVLARQGTRRIGVFAPFTSYESFLRRLSGLLHAATADGVEVAVFDVGSAAQLASPVLASIPLQARFDGLVVMGMDLDPAVEQRLVDRHIPAVVVDAHSDVFPSLVVDDAAAGRIAARHLVDLGHREIGYVAERQLADYTSQSTSRLGGFREVLEAAGGHLHVVESGPEPDDAAAAADALLDAERVTAVVAHFDRMAVGVLQAARRRGLRVPEDLSVASFDDGPVAEAAGLTTVRQPFEESGAAAFRLLGAAATSRLRVRSELQLTLTTRSSTGPAPRED
jgi:DNA-binding LacI/PurR family transcriptional regulator